MKKIYSLIAIAMLSVSAIAQTTVTYTFSGANASEVTAGTIDANLSFVAGKGNSAQFPTFYSAAPAAVRIYSDRATGDGNSFTITATEGFEITGLTFTATAAANAPAVTYSADGAAFAAMPKTGETYTGTGLTATALTFKNAHTGGSSNTQLRIASFTVTYAPKVLAVGNVNATKANLVKNTVVSNNILFAAKSDVQVINANGQVVKTASVNEGTTIDVSSLSNGIYLVSGVINGKALTQKVIKK